MSAKNNLELQGTLSAYPAAELVVEISCAGLSGSLKLSNGEKKAIFYFESGQLVFAVSNERAFRLAELLLERDIIDNQFLAENRTIANDLQLSELLVSSGKVSSEEIKRIITGLCESIIASVFRWTDGEWVYSPHSRIKTGIASQPNVRDALMEYSRGISSEAAGARFQSLSEWFVLRPEAMNGIDLQPHEAFVLSRFDSGRLALDQLISLGGLSKDALMHTVYCLWLTGFLNRSGRNVAFSQKQISTVLSANLTLKKPAVVVAEKVPRKPPEPAKIQAKEAAHEPVEIEEFVLEEVLSRIETAENYYTILGVDPAAKVPAIRKAYFRLAKQLHPDRYHNETQEILRRVEKAFTELAQAHETLKNPESRQGYDVKMRQAEKDRLRGDTSGAELTRQEDQAAKDFERGFDLQLRGEYEEALPYLARAVYYVPNNARYHAFYGKVLSMDESQRHKAENELSTAVRLEAQNETFRLMLIEFFIHFKLLKRAEGELNRLLATSPNNREARALLDSLRVK
jgi:tetratricopeptide (TPR) repeat protein